MKTMRLNAARLMAIAVAAVLLAGVGRAQAPARQDTSQIQLGPSCVTSECHADLKERKFLHGPVNLNQCEPCHVPEGNKHVFKPMPAKRQTLCLTCHEQEAPKKVVHPPFGADCTLCHDPHGGDTRQFVKGGTGAEGCIRCHNDPRKDMPFLHGPVAMGECLACHSPHQSDFKNLLVDQPSNLCQSCHVDVQQELAGAVSVHPPARNDCTGCHNAHGGKVKYFLAAQGEELCRKCHGDFLEKMDHVKYPHKPMTEGKGCNNCHTPHASNQEKLLVSNNMELCLGCHNQTITKKDGTTIPNVAAQIKDSKSLHGPIREKNCIACHQAHGSDFPNILEKAFPADFYAPFTEHSYDLCFECHDRQIVEHEKSTATGFRNGDENLHYLHVNREKGRSCRACHAEHASNQPKHIRSSVPFGRWTMEVEYTKTQTGGGCATGCHLPYSYDRFNPVDNKKAGMGALVNASNAASAAIPPATPAPAPAADSSPTTGTQAQ